MVDCIHLDCKLVLIILLLFNQGYASEEQMYCVYVPTNHLYIGDIFLVSSSDVIRPNISVREGIGNAHPVLFSFFPVIFMFR